MLERFIGAYLFQPAAFDYSSDTCRNGCAYCFANINQAERCGNLQGAIKKFYKAEITTYDDALLRDGYPICVSNRSDPFTERNWRDTVALCQHLVNIPNGVYIQTKCGPGMDEALDILGEKKPVVYITVTTIRDEISRILEPNAPLPSERLKIAADLHRRGYLVLIAVNPCAEQWMPPGDLAALCDDLKASGIRHVVIEMLDMSRNRLKILPQSRIDRMCAAALDDCRTGRVRGYVRECTEYLIKAGMIVCKKGMPFRTSFFDDIKARLGKTMPVMQDFVNYCIDNHEGGAAVTFAEFDQVIRGGRGGVFSASIKGSSIRDYLLRAGFISWKANQHVPTHRELLRIVWNDPRHRISIQKHCLFKLTDKKDPEGNAVLWFDGKADLGKKKEVILL
jgi:DNA repair photolyase